MKNALFVVLVGRPRRIETIVFCDFRLFGGIEHSVQCLFFEIWRFLYPQ